MLLIVSRTCRILFFRYGNTLLWRHPAGEESLLKEISKEHNVTLNMETFTWY
jgi:hypothetical protein